MQTKSSLVILPFLVLSLWQCTMRVNESIDIADGETVRRSLNTVNGGIFVGRNCTLTGSARTVNGPIRIGEGSTVEDLQSVNGSIEIGPEVRVRGEVQTVNGTIRCAPGVRIQGSIETVNGTVDLEKTIVDRDIETITSSITLLDHSKVGGDIRIGSRNDDNTRRRRIKVRIEDESVVEGDIIVRNPDIQVTVYLLRDGRVMGQIRGAEVVEE